MNLRNAPGPMLFVAALTAAVAGALLAANPLPSAVKNKPRSEVRPKSEKAKTDPVRDALDKMFASAAASWSAKNFAAVRAQCGKALAMDNAPSHYKSYAQLRVAQSFMAEKNTAAAKVEYKKIQSNATYPDVHRHEAEECVMEIERAARGLPARDVVASRTKVSPVAAFAAEYFVSPAGNDANPGTKERPFASLEAARDAIRALKAQAGLLGPVCVRLMPSEYQVKMTFELTAADSGAEKAPIVYRADKPGTAVIYGGTRLSGFTPVTDATVLGRLPAEARGKVFQCNLRKQGVVDFAPLQERGYGRSAPKATLELFFNGEPQTLARWPNRGFVNCDKIIEPGSAQTRTPSVFTYLDDRHARWTKAQDAWLYGYFAHGWADRTLKIIRIDPSARQVACGPYDLHGAGMTPVKWFNQGKIKYFAFNLLEELDQPGEWYLDREKGVLYLYPPSDPVRAIVEIGRLAVPMVTITGAAHVRFEGLVFDLSRANCMVIRDSDHCLVAGCTVKRFASDGITIAGGHDNGILGCDIYSLGRRATEVIGGDRKTLTPARHFVENCRMYQFGRLDHTYVPAVQLEGCGNRVAHNLFYECPSSVVRIEGNDHVLEYNRVHRAVLESEDQGAMELFGNPTYRGVVFRFNYFSDIGGDFAGGSAGRAAIRLDDTISGMLIYGNIFHRASQSFGGIQINGGRDNLIDNNIFAECEKGITGGYNANNKRWERLGSAPDFIMSELYLERYPDLWRLRELPGLNSAWRNVFWKCGPSFSTYGKPSPDKFDLLANAEYATDDPGFVDSAKGDFRLRPDAPVFARIGFRPIPVDEIGLYKNGDATLFSHLRSRKQTDDR
ncbi:right-handed parallel beta-helix repeat-containing protein [Candidatus Sumerlaeota bacterium]|nr:right-handed parallel beta-helix repeat-containing protein [Candidatus Sumerlaeota bacterium]